MTGFMHVEVRGDARARGRAHGEALRERVRSTCAFYLEDLFADSPLGADGIRTRAAEVGTIVARLAPARAAEIAGIAEGAALPDWQIHALNGRTEILNANVPECTALWFAGSHVLGQNWDWVEPLEALAVVVTHEREDGSRYVVFVEPGMVGKIGLNDAGVGVCLNILFAPHGLDGLPVHVLSGALMDATDAADARRIMLGSGLGKASHVLAADAGGKCAAVEFMGDERHEISPREGLLVHTNHCLAHGERARTDAFATSCARFDRALALAGAQPGGVARMKEILLTHSPGEDALNRPYKPQSVLGEHRVGTCASIVMELDERRFHVRRGPGAGGAFQTWTL